MARTRVHELAKELNISPKDLMDKMAEMGIPFKNHMSILSSADANYLRRYFKKFSKPSTLSGDEAVAKKIIVRKKTKTDEELLKEELQSEEILIPPEEEATPSIPETKEVVEQPVSVEVTEETPEEEVEGEIELEEVQSKEVQQEVALPIESKEVQQEVEEAEISKVSDVPASREELLEEVESLEQREPQIEASYKIQEEVGQDIAREVSEAVEPSEEEEPRKPYKKKPRKRKRKKPKRDEFAKIIHIPELIPAEDEMEEALEAKIRGKIDVEDDTTHKKIKPAKKFRPKEASAEEIPSKLYSKPKREERKAEEKEPPEEKKTELEKPAAPVVGTLPPKASKRKIRIEEAIVVSDLAKAMGIKATEVIKKLLLLGLPVTVNQAIDFDTASLVASEFGYEVEKKGFEEEDILVRQEDRPEDLLPRPPVVTVMGHVDHGKTSLLDAIRHTNVTSEEAGGITQHIGAYHVSIDKGDIVFLDTPGHEAFTAMRARGAKVTDIVVLVVAADDGVMQQTIEAINHAKAANVPIIVAINKIDKPNANPEKVKRQLSELGLVPEEWGGNTIMVGVSAKKKIGIEDLLEMILLQAEIMELKANPNKMARGRVIEAKLEKGRGPVATVLIQEGTLHVGDAFVCGTNYGRVRNIFNDKGQRIEKAGPSMPVEVIGLSGVPQAGDDFVVVADEKQARTIAEHRLRKQRERELSLTTKVTLEKLYEQIRQGQLKELNLILKTDVHGSLEALSEAIKKLSHPEIKINIIHATTGAINETDIMLASASNAIVIGFNVRPDAKVEELAQREKVDVRFYNVIYQVIDDIKAAMAGLLEPEYREKVLGRAEVRQVFHISKVGNVAGCYVESGTILRNAKVRVLRDQIVVYDGKIASLRRFKEDVKEVKAGFECGILVENFNDIKVGDILEAYVLEEVRPSIDSVSSVQEESKKDNQKDS